MDKKNVNKLGKFSKKDLEDAENFEKSVKGEDSKVQIPKRLNDNSFLSDDIHNFNESTYDKINHKENQLNLFSDELDMGGNSDFIEKIGIAMAHDLFELDIALEVHGELERVGQFTVYGKRCSISGELTELIIKLNE